jgi:hypothetical protein
MISTQQERCRRAEHHVVHDYANLVSSGKMVVNGKHLGTDLLTLAPVNSHVGHAFYAYCRDMYEFFHYKPKGGYRRAQDFLAKQVTFVFSHWTRAVQEHMEIHLLHSGDQRTEREVVWTGENNGFYLADFESAWALLMGNLKDEHKKNFKDEIDHRVNSEFRHCGDLGKHFIL